MFGPLCSITNKKTAKSIKQYGSTVLVGIPPKLAYAHKNAAQKSILRISYTKKSMPILLPDTSSI